MIGYIHGKVISSEDSTVLLENNGIGYEITCSTSALSNLMMKKEGGVYTYLQVRDDGASLFGFATKEEKSMFLKLITVSGVGAKMGITVLSSMSLNDIALAIATSDVKALTRIKGLGKKTAERIIIELRERGKNDDSFPLGENIVSGVTVSGDGENAITALTGLGWTRQIATKAVMDAINSGAETVEEIITKALRSLG